MRIICKQRLSFASAATAALALAVLAFALAFPSLAHATFRDVADSFPAAQDLGEYGAPISGDQIPDGTYKIGARTTSRMCIMYTNPADTEARDSKEQAVLSVSGGSMTVLFYMSKAYTHLYMGTQEEAAAVTNAEGTDASAYIAGDPDEGYVPHLFAIPISELNSPMTISTFSGGDHGIKEGQWYTRQVVFKMTEAELQQAIAGTQQTEESQQEQSSNASTSDGAAVNGNTTNSGTQLGTTEAQSSNSSQADSSKAATPDTLRGIRLNTPGAGTAALSVPETEQAASQAQAGNQGIPILPLLLGAGFAIAFVAGVALRATLFARQRDSQGKDKQG